MNDLRGRVVVINFWATWCPPCVQELPSLLALQQQQGKDVQVIAVAADFSSEALLLDFLSQRGLAGADGIWVHHDPDLSLSGFFGIGRMPTTLIIDTGGFEVVRHEGACRWDQDDVIAFLTDLAKE